MDKLRVFYNELRRGEIMTDAEKKVREEAVTYTEGLIRESKHTFPNCWSMIREAHISGALPREIELQRLRGLLNVSKLLAPWLSASIEDDNSCYEFKWLCEAFLEVTWQLIQSEQEIE